MLSALSPLRGNLFSSRVGRRVFTLFVLSALVPVSLVGTLAYDQVLRQLDVQSREHLRRETRSIAVSLYDRLLALDGVTAAVSAMLVESDAPLEPDTLRALAGDRISAITVVGADGAAEALLGPPLATPEIGARRRRHLDSGDTLLVTAADTPHPRVLLARAAGRATVLAEASPDFLWRFDADGGQRICVVDDRLLRLHCDAAVLTEWGPDLRDALSSANTGALRHRAESDGMDELLQYKSLFLDAHFGARSWVVAASRDSNDSLLATLRFKQVFPSILLLSLLFVVLVSLVQIRRFIGPLERLREATRRLTEQDFSTPVEIDSGDEFEELADSFNHMTEHLDEMFSTLEQFSDIDGIILTAPDRDRILDTVVAHLPAVLRCDDGALIASPLRGAPGSVRLVRPPASFDAAHDVRALDAGTAAWVRAHPRLEIIEHGDALPRGLAPLGAGSPQRVLWLPFEIDGHATFGFCCAYRDGGELTERRLLNGQDLARRLTMAIADALKGEALHRQAHHDALTGLPNRHLLGLRLEQAIESADADQRRVALLFLDLDRFKTINDNLGHATGDRFLQRISERLAMQIRESDTVARFGGDEYVVLVPDLDGDVRSHARALARSLTAVVCEPCEIAGREIATSTSIGISLYPDDAGNAGNLLSHADIALYHAKRLGKDNWQFYSAELMLQDSRRLEIESALRDALTNGGLELHYQPQLDTRTKRLRGAEALLRWPGCPLGPLRPDQFVPLAEESRLILELGAWVVNAACGQARAWRDAGLHGLTISVNVSPRQFRDEGLPGMIARALDEHGLEPGDLSIEVTESVLMDDIAQASAMLARLRALGVGVSIDDFGTGHSSLEYLAHLPADTLKLDRSFVARIPADREVAVIVETLIEMAHKLGMRVVAEGIEHDEQVVFLRASECDQLQGFRFARPMPGAAFLEWQRLRAVPEPARIATRR